MSYAKSTITQYQQREYGLDLLQYSVTIDSKTEKWSREIK
jgi:hypothetical protein